MSEAEQMAAGACGPGRAALVVATGTGCGSLLALVLLLARRQLEPFLCLGPRCSVALAGMLAGVAVTCAALAAVRRAPAADDRAPALSLAFCLAGAVLLACSDACAAGSSRAVVSAVAGALLGGGVSFGAAAWAGVAGGMSPRLVMRGAAGAVVLCGVASAVFEALPSAVALGIAAGVLGAASFAAFSAVRRLTGRAGAAWHAGGVEARRLLGAISDGAQRIEAAPARLRDMAPVLWVSLCALAFVAFITGLTWDPVVSDELDWRLQPMDAWGGLVGSLVTAACILLVCARAKDDASCLGLFGRAVMPVTLAAVLVVPILKEADPPALIAGLCTVASDAGFALITVVTLAQVLFTARLSGVGPRRAVCATMVLGSLLEGVGLASIEVLGSSGRMLCFVLEAAFITAVVVYYALRARGVAGAVPDDCSTSVAPVDGEAPAPASGEETWRACCDAVAGEFGLSRREQDVLELLGRGYGSAYIAPELGISENTVRTHVRHIYEKVGVTSREGLIAIMDARVGVQVPMPHGDA